MSVTKTPLSLWSKILCGFIIAISALYIYAVFKAVYVSITTGPTYSQVCAPLYFVRKVDYYHGRTLVVCGSSTTEPVLKEYPTSK